MGEIGRPTIYNDELAIDICRKISSQSKGITRLCKENPNFPDRSTIFEWRLTNPEFSDLYDKAKLAQIEVLHDDLIEISDDTSLDLVENDKGHMVCNNEFINRSRLKIDTRKWILERLAPKKFGTKQEMTRSEDDKSLMQKLIDKL